jgi:hypothetical protein
MNKHLIFGVHVTNRLKNVSLVQSLLSEYGCNISTRLGLHPVGEDRCSPNGLILLEMFGDESVCLELKEKLNRIEGVEVKSFTFDHPEK